MQLPSIGVSLFNLRETVRALLVLAALPVSFAIKYLHFLGAHQELVAENLLLRRQLGLFIERKKRPRRADKATQLTLVLLSKFCAWKDALVVVKPETLIRWHRQGFKLLWRWKSRRGRPPIGTDVRRLIAKMAAENPLWGEERIAAELLLKTGIPVSPRTVRKYMPGKPKGRQRGSQRWSTFVRNHAKAITACDFTTAVTARFQVLYIFVIMEIGSRRILHANVTANPTAEWTLQQFREALPWKHEYRWLIHDRDSIFSPALDDAIEAMPLTVLKTPFRAPLANAFCERLIGTLRRECLDHIIPMSDMHLRVILKEWVEHYNRGRPHSSLGPGLPDPPVELPVARQAQRHHLPDGATVSCRPVLGGLHHEYQLDLAA